VEHENRTSSEAHDAARGVDGQLVVLAGYIRDGEDGLDLLALEIIGTRGKCVDIFDECCFLLVVLL
jgi:hypothetical protein